jgi:glyoxylase-like metal-dependent hydrolase (beta-lactamase superfamily II)
VSIADFKWIHGAPDCAASPDPILQSFRLDENTFILRQSKCSNFEGPFLYLLLGTDTALLIDTGAKPPPGETVPVRETVEAFIRQWSIKHHRSVVRVVAHSHGHGDHKAGDSQFQDQPSTTVVLPDVEHVKAFFHLPDWPEGRATFDLGGRALTVLPLPGHEPSHIAIYDPNSRILLTGDALYPGLLTVRDWPAYRRSANRLADFVAKLPVSYVLGAHVEMKKTPKEMYPLGSTFQPDEHPLPLAKEHVEAWRQACEAMGDTPRHDVHDEFIIEPV